MPSPATATDFLDVVRRSGLVADDRLSAAADALPAGADAARTADELIRAGVLTRFQAKQLKAGRYKRFVIAGKYQLLELLGVGGMGAVYLCEHTIMRRLVAVKVLPVEKLSSDPAALQRFHREARAVAALDHPNIVRAHDIDKYEQLHFLVMEYVDGASIQEIVARYAAAGRWFDPVRAAHYVAQAAAGIQHACELGLVHRDVKPGNLLLDRYGTVKVLDMGLARFFDHRHDGLTEKFDDNSVLGTADYLAPEQAMNETADVRADIYGLGGTLYFLLTGRSPFPDGSIAQKLSAHQYKEPVPVTAFRSDVPAALLAVLHRMMRKKPEDRYQTADDLIQALRPWTGEYIGPPPASEMPELCPAVLERGAGGPPPSGGRASSFALRPLGPGSGPPHLSESSIRVPDSTQALVPTARTADTAPINPPLPAVPAAAPPHPLARPSWWVILAVAASLLALAAAVVTMVAVLVIRR